MSRYGDLPKEIGIFRAPCQEFMFYQYLPIKLPGVTEIVIEPRLKCFDAIIGAACCDYVGFRGLNAFVAAHVYLTAKRMYTGHGMLMNRPGWHSDGFLTDDINYVWSDCLPTIFNSSEFKLTLDDEISMQEMECQAHAIRNVQYKDGSLLRLDQFCIHKLEPPYRPTLRTFIKVSLSPDRYDLAGNSHNFLLNYDWPMRERTLARNVPQHLSETQEAKS